jgi:hypothetical protein
MNYNFHPEAEREFNKAINYYEECNPNLGYDFSIEVYKTIQYIILFPEAWPKVKKNIRRCLVNRFPYGILYSIENEIIYILAVMNLHRKPDY